jgi:hypothetical protein
VRRETAIALLVAPALVAGCGGGDRQDTNEHLARQEQMVVEVRNADTKTIPNVAVTVEPGFTVRSNREDLADPNRPVWIVDDGPIGGGTAYTNTWALGPLKAGQTKKFVWKVTPVRSGSHEVRFRVAAGLNGKAKAQAAGGKTAEGSFMVNITQKPSQATVDPDTGEVIRNDGDVSDGG